MIFGNPVKGTIHISKLAINALVAANPQHARTAYWTRPPGNLDFAVTQFFGPTNIASEFKSYRWAGGDGIAAGTYPLFHIGLDLGNAHCGAAIIAAAAGTVIAVATDGSGAHYIEIDHGTVGGHHFVTGYWHEAVQLVSKGQRVAKGQQIATVGSTGNSSGCHVHFMIWKDGRVVDPFTRIEAFATVDPDYVAPAPAPAPAPESEMNLIEYQPLFSINVPKGYNIRKDPSTSQPAIRMTSGVEPWSILGSVKGAAVNGNSTWYVRVNGLVFEYVWSGGIAAPVAPPPPADISALQAEVAAKAQTINEQAAALSAAQEKIAKAQADLA